MKNKKLLLGIGVLTLVLAAGFLASGRSLQGATRNTTTSSTPATLTFAASSNPVAGENIVAGQQTSSIESPASNAVLVARYQVTASAPNSNQVTITNLTLENDYNDQNPFANDAAINQVSLHFPTSYSAPTNLNGVAIATLNADGYAEFSGLNFKLRGGNPVQFEVKVITNQIGGEVEAGDQIEMDLSPKYSAINNRTGAVIDGEVLPDGLDGPEFTLVGGAEPAATAEPEPQGTIGLGLVASSSRGNITLNSNPSTIAQWITGNGTLNGTNNFSALATYVILTPTPGESFLIDTITFENDSLGDNPLANDEVLQAVYLQHRTFSSAGVPAGSNTNTTRVQGTYVDGQLTFTNLNLWAANSYNGADRSLYVWGLFNPIGQGSNAGDQVEIDFPLDGTFHAVGQSSGAVLTQPNGNTTDVDANNRIIVAAAIPTPPPPPPSTGNSASASPTVNLLVNGSSAPVNINSGNSIALSWTTTNATACIAEAYPSGAGAWSGSRATSGSETLNQITTSRNYMLTCWSGSAPSEGTTTTDSVMVNVAAAATPPPPPPTPPPGTGNSAATSPTVNLLVNGSNGPVTTTGSVAQGGGTVNLTWSNSNVSSGMGGICTKSTYIPMPLDETIYSGVQWSGTLPSYQNTSGAISRYVPSSRTFTLTCVTPAGTAQDSVDVNVPN